MSELRTAMSALTHGVYVLGVHTPEKDNLMTCAWLSQVSGAPPMLMAAVATNHLTAQLIPQAGRFSVSVLKQDQKYLALKNGQGSGRNCERTLETSVVYSESGCPLVQGAAAHLECRLVNTVVCNDHTLFIGEVVRGKVYDANTLVYREKEFFK